MEPRIEDIDKIAGARVAPRYPHDGRMTPVETHLLEAALEPDAILLPDEWAVPPGIKADSVQVEHVRFRPLNVEVCDCPPLATTILPFYEHSVPSVIVE